MKSSLTLLTCAFTLSMSLNAATASEDPIKLVTGNDYKPFTDQSLPHGGIFTQIVTSALEQGGHAYTIEYMPWSRGLNQTIKLNYDGTFPYLYSIDRQENMLATEPVVSLLGALVTHADDPTNYATLSDVKGKTTCLPLGYENDGDLEIMEKRNEISVQSSSEPEQCYLMLDRRRIDFIWDVQAVGTYLIQNNGLVPSNFKFTPMGDRLKTDLHILVARDRPYAQDLIDRLDQSIAAYKMTDGYKALNMLYNLEGTLTQ